jgi:DNA-binding GntR family transcriptional regulator
MNKTPGRNDGHEDVPMSVRNPASDALNHESLASSAADWITNRILEGRIGPGEKVTEVSLADQMGVSRSPVREALRALSRDGLITIEPRRGAFVSELDRDDAADLYVCRLLLEPQCTRLAAEALDDQRAQLLTTVFAKMRTAAQQHDRSAYVDALKTYNWTLLSGCPNRLLFSFAESSWRASLRYWDLTVRGSSNYLDESLRRNRRMQTAVLARDGEKAAQVATAVLEFGRDKLLRLLASLPAKG